MAVSDHSSQTQSHPIDMNNNNRYKLHTHVSINRLNNQPANQQDSQAATTQISN
jgi:hypothetical protein